MAKPKMALKGWKKTELRVIIVGETGSGKTSFMSYVANMCFGRKLEELKDEFIPENESGGSGSESQTNVPSLYTIKCVDGEVPVPEGHPPKLVQILDTPGLGDTRGIEEDEKHRQQVAEEIAQKLETIDAVIIMANGTQERLGITADYALKSIETMFPRSLIKNIGFMLSNCTKSTRSFKMESLPPELRDASHWFFENPLALWKNYNRELAKAGKKDGELDDEADEDLLEMREAAEIGFKNGLKVLNSFFKWLDECAVQPTTKIRELYEKVNKINSEISNVISNLGEAEKKRKEIAKAAEDIKNNKDKILTLKDFEKIYHQDVWRQVDTPDKHSTLCSSMGCNKNCHEGCSLDFTPNSVFLGDNCNAFSSQWGQLRGEMAVCDVCKHLAREHHHYRVKWVLKSETLPGYEKAKKEYEEALKNKTGNETLKKQLDQELTAISERLKSAQEDLETLCAKYDGLAISGSFASYLQSAIQLLQQRLKTREEDLAPKEELDRLRALIENMEKKYEVIAGRKRKEESGEKPAGSTAFAQKAVVIHDVFLGF